MPKTPANSEDADRREVAERIKAALNATGKTRAWVAEEIGISNAAIYALIGGQGGWPDARAKLCAWLCLDERGFALPGQKPPAPEAPPEPEPPVKFIPATPAQPKAEPVIVPVPAPDLTPKPYIPEAVVSETPTPRAEIPLALPSDLPRAASAALRLSNALDAMSLLAVSLAEVRQKTVSLQNEFDNFRAEAAVASHDLSEAWGNTAAA